MTVLRFNHATCPGRCATHAQISLRNLRMLDCVCVALQTRDLSTLGICEDPGSAVHHYAALRDAPHPGKERAEA
jgi:hypothetical protein